MPTKRMLPATTPIVKGLDLAIRQLLVIIRRLPFLLAIKAEGEQMLARGGRLKNDALLEMFLDSHHMLVIDLDGLRERMAEKIFKLLCQHRNVLRPFVAKDMAYSTG